MLNSEPDPTRQHVYPLNDTREHTLVGVTCWCNPKLERVDGEVLIIHSATDGRPQDVPFLHGAS